MNVVIISGTIDKLWDEKETKNGTRMRGAVLEHVKDNGFKARFDLSSFGAAAEKLGTFPEGSKIVVQGELDVNSYKKGEEWVNKVQVNVRGVELFGDAGQVPVAAGSAVYEDDPF